jgi:hypothetical protein
VWSPSYLYYVVCPRSQDFVDYFPARLREEFVKEGLRLGKDGESPLIELEILARRPIASVSTSLGTTEETIGSVTLRDPENGLVVGTAICIGLTSSSAVKDRTSTTTLAQTRRTPWRRPARGMVPARSSWSHAGKSALWAGGWRLRQGEQPCGRQRMVIRGMSA